MPHNYDVYGMPHWYKHLEELLYWALIRIGFSHHDARWRAAGDL